jgi:hypothetical protein
MEMSQFGMTDDAQIVIFVASDDNELNHEQECLDDWRFF